MEVFDVVVVDDSSEAVFKGTDEVGAAFNRKLSFISLTSSSILSITSLVCLLGIIGKLSS